MVSVSPGPNILTSLEMCCQQIKNPVIMTPVAKYDNQIIEGYYNMNTQKLNSSNVLVFISPGLNIQTSPEICCHQEMYSVEYTNEVGSGVPILSSTHHVKFRIIKTTSQWWTLELMIQ